MPVSALSNALGLSLLSDPAPMVSSAPQETSRGRSRVRVLREEAHQLQGARLVPPRTSASAMPAMYRRTSDGSQASRSAENNAHPMLGALRHPLPAPTTGRKNTTKAVRDECSAGEWLCASGRRSSDTGSPASDWPGYDSPLFEMSPLGPRSPRLSQEDLSQSFGYESVSSGSAQTLMPYPAAHFVANISSQDIEVALENLPFAIRVANRPSWHSLSRFKTNLAALVTVACTTFHLDVLQAPESIRRSYVYLTRDPKLSPRQKLSILLFVANHHVTYGDASMGIQALEDAKEFLDGLHRHTGLTRSLNDSLVLARGKVKK